MLQREPGTVLSAGIAGKSSVVAHKSCTAWLIHPARDMDVNDPEPRFHPPADPSHNSTDRNGGNSFPNVFRFYIT